MGGRWRRRRRATTWADGAHGGAPPPLLTAAPHSSSGGSGHRISRGRQSMRMAWGHAGLQGLLHARQPEGTHTKIVFAVSTINKLVSHKISIRTPPVVSHKVSTPALLYQIVMYLTFIVFCTRALPCPPLKMRCTHGRLHRRPSPPGQLTAAEMTPRPLQNALAQWLPARAVISARLGAGRLQLVCQD